MVEVSSPRDWAATAPQGRGLRIAGGAAGVFLGIVLLVPAADVKLHRSAGLPPSRSEAQGLSVFALPALDRAAGSRSGWRWASAWLLVLGVRRLWVLVPAALPGGLFPLSDWARLLARRPWPSSPPRRRAAASATWSTARPLKPSGRTCCSWRPLTALAFAGRVPRLGGPTRGPRRSGGGRGGGHGRWPSAWRSGAPALPLDDPPTRLKTGVAHRGAALRRARGRSAVCLPTVSARGS